MKKNRMMRLASMLLVAVLVSTSAISGTYAKYVTMDTASDTARVAKFGVTVEATSDMFSDSYKDTKTPYTPGETGDSITVQSATKWDDVIAPGTKGAMTDVLITGTPEVDVRVTYDATVSISDNWMVDGDEYFPVYFTIEGKTYGIAGDCGVDCNVKATSIANLLSKVEAAIEACKKDYDANTDLSTVASDVPTVSWEWPFHTSDANDKKDTKLGDKAVAEDVFIAVAIATTVEQID